ncbi:MAG: ROK family protein [Acidimicrobiia bacterium]|nr:ROK family protein [Acidimicrobiia bacterium]
MTERVGIGLDIGGTKVLGAVVSAQGEVLTECRVPSPTSTWAHLLAAIEASVTELRGSHPGVESVGIGAAGMVDLDGSIHYSPNVPAFRSTRVRADVEAAVGLPTTVDNDANVAAYAEVRFGAAAGMTDAMVITLGTGIGGGIIVGGAVLRGANGFAAEVGHFQVDPNGPPCACGEIGHWEAMASGTALGVMARAAAERGELASALALAGGAVEAITGQHVSEAARGGAADALTVIDAYGGNVAVGLVGLANIFDPGVIAIAGGIVNDGDLYLEPIRRHFLGHIEGASYRPRPEIVPATLGERAGVIGAAILALDHQRSVSAGSQ